jgi:lysophospholipid acyltransferase (LPLAT)-like uncharacterized protein
VPFRCPAQGVQSLVFEGRLGEMGISTLLKSLRIYILAALAAVVIRLLHATIRWQWLGFEQPDLQSKTSPPMILAFWHGRIIMACTQYTCVLARRRKRPGHMLISRHGDGRIIAAAVRLLGVRSVAGSSSRGGMAAVRELIRCSKAGSDLGITPDGPRGPRHVCKDGIVTLARLSGAPIYPLTYATERFWQLRSWDGMIIPRPFSRGVAMVGTPVLVTKDEDTESARQRIQESLDELTQRADSYFASR